MTVRSKTILFVVLLQTVLSASVQSAVRVVSADCFSYDFQQQFAIPKLTYEPVKYFPTTTAPRIKCGTGPHKIGDNFGSSQQPLLLDWETDQADMVPTMADLKNKFDELDKNIKEGNKAIRDDFLATLGDAIFSKALDNAESEVWRRKVTEEVLKEVGQEIKDLQSEVEALKTQLKTSKVRSKTKTRATGR